MPLGLIPGLRLNLFVDANNMNNPPRLTLRRGFCLEYGDMPAGRPTKYKPEYAEAALGFMAQGFSKTATAGKLGVCVNTLKGWTKDNPEFLTAIKDGEAARTAFLEETLLAAPDGPTVTSRIFALKNAAPDEWRDKREHEHTGKDGANLTFNVVRAKNG